MEWLDRFGGPEFPRYPLPPAATCASGHSEYNSGARIRVAKQCFRSPESEPPVCGVHNGPLQSIQTAVQEPSARYFVCPASGEKIKRAYSIS